MSASLSSVASVTSVAIHIHGVRRHLVHRQLHLHHNQRRLASVSLSTPANCLRLCPHHHPPRLPRPPAPPLPANPNPASSIPHSRRPLSLSAPLSSPARRSAQPKTETRPLSDASRAHLLASASSSSPHAASASLLKDGDWLCSKCHFLNFATRTTCWRCAHAPSPAQRQPIRTSQLEPVVVGMRAATVLGKPVVLVFVDMPLATPDHGHGHAAAADEWATPTTTTTTATATATTAASSCTHSHSECDATDHLHLLTEAQTPIANLTDDLFQSLKLSPSPITLSLEHAYSTASLPLLTGDWICPSCSVVNYAFRDNCFKCDHDALDSVAAGRRLVVLPHTMMSPQQQQQQSIDSKSVLVALAKVQGLWQGSLVEGKSRVGPLWACTNCLYVNRWGAHSCRKCGHDRDGWSRNVHRLAVVGEQRVVPVEQQQAQPAYVWVDRGAEPQQEQGQEQEEYGEDEGQDLVPKIDLTGRTQARDKAAVARANRGWKRSEASKQRGDGDEDEWDCD